MKKFFTLIIVFMACASTMTAKASDEKSTPKPIVLDLHQNDGEPNPIIHRAPMRIYLDNLVKQNHSKTSLLNAVKHGIITKTEYFILKDQQTITALGLKPANLTNQMAFDFGEKPNNIIKLYKQAIRAFSKSYTDIGLISNRYISEILSTMEFDESQKDNLISSICVLASSAEYWDIFNKD